MRNKPRAVFMAFGTKGDVYPIAAIAAAFACDQEQYKVLFITHSAHENLAVHLAAKTVAYVPITSPPVFSHFEDNGSSGSAKLSFSLEKKKITEKHRKECASVVENIFSNGPSMEGDFIVINFFALEGWCLAELFKVCCVIAAPYVVPYSAPSSFERRFMEELPLLYKYFQEAPFDKVCWKDVIHWMWPLFTEEWGSWRSVDLNLSPWPFTDPVTGVPTWHHRIPSPLLLYGFSKEVVECPGYWPSNARVCGFWFLPMEWQFSCNKCYQNSPGHLNNEYQLCSSHVQLKSFLDAPASVRPVFIGLSSVGSMGFVRNPQALLKVLKTVLEKTSHRFILFSAGYEPLDVAIKMVAAEASSCSEQRHGKDGVCLYSGRLFCFSGTIPYSWLFPRCIAAIHHGGSGSTAAALHAGIPQVICPCMLDQFYWAERVFWLGVAPEPLKRVHLLPDKDDDKDIGIAANMLARAINCALSPDIQARALEIAGRLFVEDGVLEAVKILKEGISQSDFWKH